MVLFSGIRFKDLVEQDYENVLMIGIEIIFFEAENK